jgi:hypothetical protein
MKTEIGLFPLSFFVVMLSLAITAGIWLPRIDAILVALEAAKP